VTPRPNPGRAQFAVCGLRRQGRAHAALEEQPKRELHAGVLATSKDALHSWVGEGSADVLIGVDLGVDGRRRRAHAHAKLPPQGLKQLVLGGLAPGDADSLAAGESVPALVLTDVREDETEHIAVHVDRR